MASETAEHVWDDGAIKTAATPDSDGVKLYTCVCGATKEEEYSYETVAYTLTFHMNDGSDAFGHIEAHEGDGISMPAMSQNYTHPDGLYLMGWTTSSDGSGQLYGAGSKYTVTGDAEFFAQWGEGQQVMGTVQSWDNVDNVVFALYGSNIEDTAIRSAWQAGTYASLSGLVPCTVNKGAISASGKNYLQAFSMDGVAAGSYKLAIFKPGKYVPKIVSITVSSSAFDFGVQKLWLYGDVNGDGKVNGTDATQIQRYYANKSPNALLNGTAQDIADKKLAADVNNDNKINGTDATQVQRYYANKSPNAFEKLK